MILTADFDGTIFIDGKISQKDIKAIRDFQQAGNLFAIVTGRSFASLTPLIEGKIKPDSLICNNGGHIFVKDKNELREVLKAEIHPDKARDFLKFYENKIDNQLAIFTESAKINNLENINESIMALAIYSDDEIVNHFPEDFDFHYSIGVIDVVKKGINKQGGIDFIKDYYSFNGEIIAIGDDYNDIDFLKNTPLSYTLDYVTNEAVREVCNYSVKSVADLIENLMEGI
ncbi:HAD family hydrolase [Anaerococcus lactolyticus]|uniref:Haloacid dehalogenase n=1 Tax=Anaerococcus lactolyticus S7-1-13 TaxID=1284686 RepID=A0A095YDP8_9FIRM|nr:HAD-IIB family hydrolase [Anaerococcus lactolyticus]KGF04712.1 haloacid dehalogenase [Anaerococcus lactolyticus S7-1-13]